MIDRGLFWGGGCIALVALCAVAAPWMGLRDPAAQPDGLVLRDLPPFSRVHAVALADGTLRYAHEIREGVDGSVDYRRGERWERISRTSLAGPAAEDWRRRPLFLLGTDGLGRDLLSRLIYGARVSMLIGFSAAAIALLFGAAVGLCGGLAGGLVDAMLMRFTDLVLSVPRLFLALMLVALYGASLTTTVLVLAGTTWMAAARLVRGEILSARGRDYVQAARAAGAPAVRVGLLHLLPVALAPLLVEGTLRVGDTILLEAALSFLGLGVPPPIPSWGNLIADGRSSLVDAWWIATLPGLAVAGTVISLSFVGDAMRRRFSGVRSRAGYRCDTRLRTARSGDAAPSPPGTGLLPAPGRMVLLAAVVLAGTAAPAESPVHLTSVRDARSARIVAHNSAAFPVTVTLELTEQRNLDADRTLPIAATVPAGSEAVILSLDQADPSLPWSFRYRWSWTEGAHEARHDGTRVYSLPYPEGFAFKVAQNQDDHPSHNGPHAIDWLIPAGTPVSAARGGTVARVDRSASGLVHVLHADGTIGCYLGLAEIRVRLGDPVETGDPLAVVAGPRGFDKPHLHFHVFRATDRGGGETVPVTFESSDALGETLEPERVYMRPQPGSGPAPSRSLPVNAIASLATCLKVDRTGHPVDATTHFGTDDVVHVHVSLGAPGVYTVQVEFLRAGEAKPASIRRFPTEPEWDGVDLTLDLSGIPEPQGSWEVRALIDDEVQARTAFHVAD